MSIGVVDRCFFRKLAWKKFHNLATSWVAVFPFRLPATSSFCTKGLQRALTRRNGNTATQLFSNALSLFPECPRPGAPGSGLARRKLHPLAASWPAKRAPSVVLVGLALVIAAALPRTGGAQTVDAEHAEHAPRYAVGNTTLFIHDPSRGYDEAAGVSGGIRTLITEVWYPISPEIRNLARAPTGNSANSDAKTKEARDGPHAEQGGLAAAPYTPRRATYGDYVFGNRAVHRLMMSQTTFFHLTPETVSPGITQARIDDAIDELFDRERASFVDAPIARAGAPFPVIVMSHGDAGSRYNMQTVCEHLAANGYVVIAPEHTGNSPFSMSGEDPALGDNGNPEFKVRMTGVVALFNEYGTYGPLDNFGQSYTPLADDRSSAAAIVALDSALLQRIADLRATLRELERLNEDGTFAGSLDLDRIGLMGRSFGASTVLSALPLERRFLAGAAVVPPSMPDPRPAMPPELLAPPDRESAILSADGPYGMGEISRPTLLLAGAEDRLIIAIAESGAEAMNAVPPTADNRFPVLRAAFESSKAPALWAMLDNANHATLGVSGDYWWPEMKPREFPRYFEPSSTYQLIDPELAHRIQREKVLAFFDLFVANKPGARARLLSDNHADDGLELEHRNF